MAGNELTFTIASETAAFDRGVRQGIIDPLQDAEKELEQLGKEGDRELERVEDGMHDAQRKSEEFRDELKDLARQLTNTGRDGGRDVGDGIKRGFDGAEESVEDFKQEAGQTARETAASFDGSADSIVGAFQEIAANAFAGFGPAGAIAGLAAAAGIGLAQSAMQQSNDLTEEGKEKASEWAQSYIDAGTRILTNADLVAKVQSVLTDPDQYETASQNAELWGTSVSTAAAAMAGVPFAVDAVKDAIDGQSEALATGGRQGYDYMDMHGQMIHVLGDSEQQLIDAKRAFQDVIEPMQQGRQQASEYSQFLRDLAEHTDGAKKEIDIFGDSITTLPDGTKVYIDAETGQATTDVDAIEQKIYSVPTVKQIDFRANLDDLDGQLSRWIAKPKPSIPISVFLRDGGVNP